MSKLRYLLPLVFAVLPVLWFRKAGWAVLSLRELDSVGHYWTVWNASRGPYTTSDLVAFPHGADLLPILGGWLDIFIAGTLARLGVSLVHSFNGVLVLYIGIAGLGVFALSRAMGASPLAATVAGLLAQLDQFLHHHIQGGRTEQAAVGFVALAFALALSSWRKPGVLRVVACGLAGAGVVYASWEYGFWLALAMGWLAPFLWWSGRPDGAVRRWVGAALVCVAAVGPFAAAFLVRSAAIRKLDEGLDTMGWAPHHSEPLLGWFLDAFARTSVWVMAPILLLPLAARREDRRLVLGIMSGLVVSLVLATGPEPGIWQVGDLGLKWGPYSLLQSLPIMGWFHTPQRLLVGWIVVAPVAVALSLDLLAAQSSRWLPRPVGWTLAAVAAAGLMVVSVEHSKERNTWPQARWLPPRSAPMDMLAQSPLEGALLELPPRDPGIPSLRFMETQLSHHRPSPYHATLPHLTKVDLSPVAAVSALYRWSATSPDLGKVPTEVGSLEEAQALVDLGYSWVAIHPSMIPRDNRRSVLSRLRRGWGSPDYFDLGIFACWELPRVIADYESGKLPRVD